MDVINPYTQAVIQQVDDATEAGVREAIANAYAIRGQIAAMPAHRRARILTRTTALIEQQHDELAALMVAESGKPLRYAKGEVNRAVETFTFAADAARNFNGETISMDAAKGGTGKFGYYLRVPVGVIAAITPFNFPLNLVAHKVAPAIAAGCPIVLKPAPMTPLTSLKLMAIMREAGLPAHAFQVVTGGADVGRWLTTDPRVAMITFTGSPPVAKAISEVAGIRPVTFELGGNAATIIDETADALAAVDRLVVGSFAYSGQVCISVQRIYVHEAHYTDFKAAFLRKVKALKAGDPADAQTEIGPLITVDATERVEAWVNEAVDAGAVVLCGGERDGHNYQPTVLEQVTPDMRVMKYEVFGPVVNIIPFTDFTAALQAVDDSEFGLQAGVYTQDIGRMMEAVNTLNVGGVIINDVPTFRVDHMPYGGNKQSGVGREGPRFAMEAMTTLKMVVINP